MRIMRLIFFLLSSSGLLFTEENIDLLDQQAQALWVAQDYAGASQMYGALLKKSLPDWQKVRILYNLGTIKLSQQQTRVALEFFHKINPQDLLFPSFGRDLFLNMGIAYLQFAEFYSNEPDPFLEEQLLFIHQSLRAFRQSKDIDCQLQEKEGVPQEKCQTYFLIQEWMKRAHSQEGIVEEQIRQEEAKKVSTQAKNSFPKEGPIAILKECLKDAHKAFLSTLLFSINSEKNSEKIASTTKKLIQDQQTVLKQAARFIPAVLKEQTAKFQTSEDPISGCQQTPWEQAIPLFDQGYQLSVDSEKELHLSSFEMQKIQMEQQQTINDWHQALNLLLHPPALHQNQKNANTSENLTNTFRIIQEMYQQDQAAPEQENRELHSW